MNKLTQSIKQFLNDEEGVTAIEYALIASAIAVVIIVAVQALGVTVNSVFQDVDTAMKG